MPTVEERLATLEGRVQEQGAFMADLRVSTAEAFDQLRREMILRFEQVDRRFEQVDRRFEQVDRRFEQIDRRFEQIDGRFEQIDGRFDRVDDRFTRVERQIFWLIGIAMTGFTGVIAALVGARFS